MRTAAVVGTTALLSVVALGACSSSDSSGGNASAKPSASASKSDKNAEPACQKKPMKEALMAAGAPIKKMDGKPTCTDGWAGAFYILDGNQAKERAMFQAKNGAWKVVPGSDVNTYCQPGDDTVPPSVTDVACVT